MSSLKSTIDKMGSGATAILSQTIVTIRFSMESGLKVVFIIGALAMLLTFLIICTLPEIAIKSEEGE
jgi:hypothetical protein